MLTDGRIWLTADGEEQKAFHVRDGQGIVLLHHAGIQTGIISGRASAATERRARELGMAFLRQGVKDKVASAWKKCWAKLVFPQANAPISATTSATLKFMKRVGFAVAVADAAEEAKQVAHHVTRAAGGYGAVREVCEAILQAQEHASKTVRLTSFPLAPTTDA